MLFVIKFEEGILIHISFQFLLFNSLVRLCLIYLIADCFDWYDPISRLANVFESIYNLVGPFPFLYAPPNYFLSLQCFCCCYHIIIILA